MEVWIVLNFFCEKVYGIEFTTCVFYCDIFAADPIANCSITNVDMVNGFRNEGTSQIYPFMVTIPNIGVFVGIM